MAQVPVVQPTVIPPTRDQVLALFQAYFEALRVQAGIPGLAAAVVGDSDVLWEQSFGQQDVGGNPTRTDTPFHLNGLTQLVTASMVLQCVDQHRVDLDSPIGL